MFFGVSFYSYTVGAVAGIIAKMDTKSAILQGKLATLNNYASRIDLPEENHMRIARFLQNDCQESNSLVEQEHLLQDLPASLRLELITFTRTVMINKITFLKDKNSDFLWKILPLLKAHKVFRGDLLYAQQDLADEIYFVIQGSFMVYFDLSDFLALPPGTIDNEK